MDKTLSQADNSVLAGNARSMAVSSRQKCTNSPHIVDNVEKLSSLVR